jgi:transcriptional regulator with XRE-family HTH domain
MVTTINVVMSKLSTRLRAARIEKGLSARQLSKDAGLSHSHVAQIESGAMSPGIDVVIALAVVLGTTVADLIGEDAAAKPKHARKGRPERVIT